MLLLIGDIKIVLFFFMGPDNYETMCKYLDQVDFTDAISDEAGEDRGADVEENEHQQIAGSLSEVVDLLPLEVVAFHIAWVVKE